MLSESQGHAIRSQLPTLKEEDAVKVARRDELKIVYDQENFGLWTSPNRRILPVPVPALDEIIPFTLQNTRKMRWMESRSPYLGFMPTFYQWTGIFSCLDTPIDQLSEHITYIPGCNGYHLSETLVNQFEELQYSMLSLARGLIQRNIQDDSEGIEIQDPKLPWECGYRDTFTDAAMLYDAIFTSRNSFLILSAFLSFAIALDMAKNPTLSNDEPPSWVIYAEQVRHIDPLWIKGLRDTFVCDFSPFSRCGTYLHCSTPIHSEVLDAYLVAGVSLFICWTYWPQYLRPDAPLWRFRPCHAEAKYAIDLTTMQQLLPQDDYRGRYNWWYNMLLPGVVVSEDIEKGLELLPFKQFKKGPAPAGIPRYFQPFPAVWECNGETSNNENGT
ncbi:hypothetical protein H0H93_006763 [Arthromyces matolae]|nr:hypothetical protein H0H93_006763 [Arthromyces matolae]